MSERKVLNKYYPPDFDPTKIPRLKGPRNKTFNIRVMAPFNMRCNTCGEYIYKGKKFNSRKETAENENYLGLHIHRFYIKCPRCVAEIAFKTDPENTDYTLEAGATRNFEAAKTAMALAVKAQKEKEEDELNNPMKVLENRTKASRNEMERIENLEELRELNSRHAKVDHETMIKLHAAYEEQLRKLQDEEDEASINAAFGKARCKRLADDSDDDSSDQESGPSRSKILHTDAATDILVQTTPSSGTSHKPGDATDVSSSSKPRDKPLQNLVKAKQSVLNGLVVRKKAKENDASEENAASSNANEHCREISEKFEKSQTEDGGESTKNVTTIASITVNANKGALSLLGDYSESDESD